MSTQPLHDSTIEEIFRGNLNIESNPMSIESLFTGRLRNRIIYDPYYQRKYVWDKNKATYFIESILLGTEIPPLVFFNSGKQIEVIDGRQRYQTIDGFIKGDFELSRRGLVSLKSLQGRKYEGLSDAIRNTFLDTALRVIEFTIVSSQDVTESQEDMIKKEVFRRYNSGITALRKPELEKAEYISNDLSEYFRDMFRSNANQFEDVVRILGNERNKSKLGDQYLLDEMMIRVRKLLVLHEVPIRYYESSPGKEVARLIYEKMYDEVDPYEVYKSFHNKLNILKSYYDIVSTQSASNNHYLYETLYWSLAILEKEGIPLTQVSSTDFIEGFGEYVKDHSHVYDADTALWATVTISRFETTIRYFGEMCSRVDLSDLYVSNKIRGLKVNEYRNDEPPPAELPDITAYRLNKPDAQTITVENLKSRMIRRRFLVRPPYQRHETITPAKASAIIESMLLGIKLPPIFVFNRNDGVMEVLDGQQRVLAILGFMRLEFLDERGEWSRSIKDGYPLRNLRILPELNGKRFKELDTTLQDKLWDFKLYQVNIDERLNPQFDPVDLYIRLNNKPFPIKDNTFEMWNSYIDRGIIQDIKDRAASCQQWFYLRSDNKRMDDETLYTTLAFLEYHKRRGQLDSVLDFYTRDGRPNVRLKSTGLVTRLLETASHDDTEKERFLKASRAVDSFIRRKVRTVLLKGNVAGDLEIALRQELSQVFDTDRRTRGQFYMLWYVLSGLQESMIVSCRDVVRGRIDQVMRFMRRNEFVPEEYAVSFLHDLVKSIWEDHRPDDRNLRLDGEDIDSRILMQNNTCPVCGELLFVGDVVEVDHIIPISLGGPDSLENIQIVHWICNRQKGNRVS